MQKREKFLGEMQQEPISFGIAEDFSWNQIECIIEIIYRIDSNS